MQLILVTKFYMDKKKSIQIQIRYFIPLIHFLLTFAWERMVLLFDQSSALQVAFSISISNTFSIEFERIMCYAISKIMAGVNIFAIWSLFFAIVDKKIKKNVVIIFGSIWALLMITTIIQWPDCFIAGGDNYIPFSYSLRLMPEYWHSVLLSCLYTASMMVVPHAISISLLQCTFFVFAVGYLYYRIENCHLFSDTKWIKYLSFCLFFFRDSFNVTTNPERAEYNASFLLILVTFVVFDIIEKKKRSKKELAVIILYASFLAVFRSEGIIVAIPAVLILLIVNYRLKFFTLLEVIVLIGACVLVIKLPGKVGEKKYYGQDYSIVNTFPTLKNIFNSDAANLSYNGANEDLDAIDAVTPINLIAEYGTWGYRRYNYVNGQVDFNQSLSSSDVSDAYMSAYKSIVIHNIPIYLKTQGSMLLSALGTGIAEYDVPYNGEHTELEELGRDIWEVGVNDTLVIPGRYKWENFSVRNSLIVILTTIRMKYYLLITDLKIYAAFNIALILLGLFILFFSFVKIFKKRYEYLAPLMMSTILCGYFAALSLVMPTGANMYFHAYFYSMFAVLIVFISLLVKGRNNAS